MITKVAIVGGGPAGSSLAIRLALNGYAVSLAERNPFPREKLCGEFISPECFDHFRALGVDIFSGGGDRVTETVFYSQSGRSVSIPTEWFGSSKSALSLSRSEMDLRLLQRAIDMGVDVHQSAAVVGLLFDGGIASGIRIKTTDNERLLINADIVIDATGRSRVLSKLLKRDAAAAAHLPKTQTSSLVAFKAHFENAAIKRGRCEIFAFPGGYGGLSNIEGDLANFCFLVRSEVARKFGGKAETALKELVFRNSRAASALENAIRTEEWLAASIDSFGKKELNPFPGIYCVGDAAAFVDPFTGSGMLMAMESADILAACVDLCRDRPDLLPATYETGFHRHFAARLRFCRVLRQLAFIPAFATLAVVGLGISDSLAERIARATRRRGSTRDRVLDQ